MIQLSHSGAKPLGRWVMVTSLLIISSGLLPAEITITVNRNNIAAATSGFRFAKVPPPARNDAATGAAFVLVDGRRDINGGDLNQLHDGKVPFGEDQPSANFFFRAGTDGGRVQMDLGRVIDLQQVNTFSWHPGSRGPQVYTLFASDGLAEAFEAQPKIGAEPAQRGWKRLAKVDTRPKQGEAGGQYGVSISDPGGILGRFRYLLFDIAITENKDPFGNTFYSEIDVVEDNAPAPEPVEESKLQSIRDTIDIAEGKYQVVIDTSEVPDLTEWARAQIIPMVQAWYPKLIELLPSEGYEAPASFSIIFDKEMRGVAATSGRRIRCSANWMRQNLKGEAVGAVFHEMVHVVQQYGRAPRSAGSTRPPGWLTEGITDYLRFYLFEPQTRGAEITPRSFSRARYDGSYRITANFLNWVSEQQGPEFVRKLNAVIREGQYNEATWKLLAGQNLPELGEAWRADLAKKLGVATAPTPAPAADSSNQ